MTGITRREIMMALKAFYTTEAEVPESLREHYVQAEGEDRFVLAVEEQEGFALENVANLKSALGRLKDEATKANNSLKPFAALKAQPEEIAEALAELATLREAKGDESEQMAALRLEMDNLKKSAKTELEKALAPVKSLSDSRLEQIKELLIDTKLQAAIIEEGGSPKLLMPVLKNEVRATTNDEGKVVVEIVDADGSPRVTGADLSPMSFSDLVREKKQDDELAVAFKANGHSGGGTEPDTTTRNGNGRALRPEDVERMSPAEYRKAREGGLIPA